MQEQQFFIKKSAVKSYKWIFWFLLVVCVVLLAFLLITSEEIKFRNFTFFIVIAALSFSNYKKFKQSPILIFKEDKLIFNMMGVPKTIQYSNISLITCYNSIFEIYSSREKPSLKIKLKSFEETDHEEIKRLFKEIYNYEEVQE